MRVSKVAMHRPRAVVDRIYRALSARGYVGAPPDFGPEWRDAFE